MQKFLTVLPQIAGHPLAIVAYVLLAFAWLLALWRRKQTEAFLRALEAIPEADRQQFAKQCGYKYEEIAQLKQRDRLKLLTSRYILIAYVVTVVAILLVFVAMISVVIHATNSARMAKGDRYYVKTLLWPGVYKSEEFEPKDLTKKTEVITAFLRSLGYDPAAFGNFPTRLISPLGADIGEDAGDLQIMTAPNGTAHYELTVKGNRETKQPVLLRTESQ